MVTVTPSHLGEVVEADIFTFEERKYLTTICRLTTVATAWPSENKSTAKMREALMLRFSVMESPETLVVDCGRVFQTAWYKTF